MIKLNGNRIVATKFPDKTSQIWKLPDDLIQSDNQIIWDFESESELVQLIQLQCLIQRYNGKSALTMPYLPYARQDKPVSNSETFALRSFLNIIRQLEFTTVSAFDPHNESVVKEYLNNFIALSPVHAIVHAISSVQPDVICYPDAGAKARYSKLLDHKHVYANKVRHQTSGCITSIEVHGNCADKSILIVDDICDGGMTFIKIAEALKAQYNIKEISLYVSHGLFTRGTEVLRQAGIQRIFTQYGEVK